MKVLLIILLTSFISGKSQADYILNEDLTTGVQNDKIFSLSKQQSNDKKTIAIWPFQGDNKFGAIEDLHSIVTDAVNKSERFHLVERAKLDAILQELDIQKGYESMNSDVLVEQGRALGANYHMFGQINSVSTKTDQNRDSKGRSYTTYTCVISLNLRIVDIETGLVKETETITVGQDLFEFISARTEAEAWNKSCKKIGSKTTDFIKKAFPVTISIIQIEKEKKGRATEILIAGGSVIGLKKNDKLNVYEITELEVDGEMIPREQEIASLSVSDVQGGQLSVCKVRKGGEDLKNKILGGAKLICKTN